MAREALEIVALAEKRIYVVARAVGGDIYFIIMLFAVDDGCHVCERRRNDCIPRLYYYCQIPRPRLHDIVETVGVVLKGGLAGHGTPKASTQIPISKGVGQRLYGLLHIAYYILIEADAARFGLAVGVYAKDTDIANTVDFIYDLLQFPAFYAETETAVVIVVGLVSGRDFRYVDIDAQSNSYPPPLLYKRLP